MRATFVCLLLLAPASPAFGQTWEELVRQGQEEMARRDREEQERAAHAARLHARDKALGTAAKLKVADDAAAFIRRYGDTGVSALNHCANEKERAAAVALGGPEPPSGFKAVLEWWASGKLEQLPYPKAAVELVARYGTKGLGFLTEYHAELKDPLAFEAVCLEPHEFVEGFKEIQAGARALAARRKAEAAWGWPSLPPLPDTLGGVPWPWAGGAVGVLALLVLVRVWRRRREEAL